MRGDRGVPLQGADKPHGPGRLLNIDDVAVVQFHANLPIQGDPDILVVADAGYDGLRLAWLLRDLPVQILARIRADRVLSRAALPLGAASTRRTSARTVIAVPPAAVIDSRTSDAPRSLW